MIRLGLLVHAAGLPLLLWWVLSPGPLATARLVVGLSALLPALVCGVIGFAALLRRRRWGRVLVIIALGLGLATALSFGVVWLSLVPQGRALTALGLAILWLLQLLALLVCCKRQPL